MSKLRTELYSWEHVDARESALRAKRELGQDHDLLTDDVRFGLQLMRQLVDKGLLDRSSVTAVVVILMFRRVLAALDAMDLLINAGAVTGAYVETRTAMEAMASLLYMVRKNNEFVAVALLMGTSREKMEEHWDTLRKNVAGSGPTIEAHAGLDRIQAFIGEDRVRRQVQAELDQLRQERGLGVRWFEVQKGPRTLEGLVRGLGFKVLDQMFDRLYGPLSRVAHCEDILDGLGDLRALRTTIRPVRGVASVHARLNNHEIVSFAHAVFVIMVGEALRYFDQVVPERLAWWQDRHAKWERRAESP